MSLHSCADFWLREVVLVYSIEKKKWSVIGNASEPIEPERYTRSS